MSGPSKIEWTQATWNPVTGCTKVSPGCDRCYAETFAERWRGVPGHPYEQGFDLRLWPERLNVPRRWRKPRRIFVNSMSDLFHAKVPFEFVDRVWATMAATPQHTYQILTKRPDRMARYSALRPLLPNVWLGTSVEDQARIGRLDDLRQANAALRFVSAEPLLGPLDLTPSLGRGNGQIDWLIIGGESDHGARPMEFQWARDLIAQCRTAGMAVFVKQLGTAWARRGKGDDMERWPADLRIREMPA